MTGMTNSASGAREDGPAVAGRVEGVDRGGVIESRDFENARGKHARGVQEHAGGRVRVHNPRVGGVPEYSGFRLWSVRVIPDPALVSWCVWVLRGGFQSCALHVLQGWVSLFHCMH